MSSVVTAVGLGLVAGGVGTVVMTAGQTVEMRLSSREPSTVPGRIGARLLGRPADPELARRLNTPFHWAHGLVMGLVRGLLALTVLGPALATLAHYVVVWGGDALLYRGLGGGGWPWRWRRRDLAVDLFHKGVYVLATGGAFEVLWVVVRSR